MSEGQVKARLSQGVGQVQDVSLADLREAMGVASGATQNETDAHLKSRANHTGEQAISSVSGLQSALEGKAPASEVTNLSGVVSEIEDDVADHATEILELEQSQQTLQADVSQKADSAEVTEALRNRAEMSQVASLVGPGIWIEEFKQYLISATFDGTGLLVEGTYRNERGVLKIFRAVEGVLVSENWSGQEDRKRNPGVWIPGFGYAIKAILEEETGYLYEAQVEAENGEIITLRAVNGELQEIVEPKTTKASIWLDPWGYAQKVTVDRSGHVVQALCKGENGNLIPLIAQPSGTLGVLGSSTSLTSLTPHTGNRYARSPNNKFPAAFWPYDDDTVLFFLTIGQSFGIKTNPDVNDQPVSGETPYQDNLFMFGIEGEDHGYVRPYWGSEEPLPVDRFVPLKEHVREATKETMASGLGETIYEAIKAYFPDADPKILQADVGSGGARYEGIGPMSRFAGEEAIRLLTAATEIAARDGMRIKPILIIQHGEADNFEVPEEGYAEMLMQLRRFIEEAARDICGTQEPLPCFVNQCTRGQKNSSGRGFRKVTSAPAGLLAEQRDPNIVVCSGLYALEPDAWAGEGGGAHLSALGYRRGGEMLAQYIWEYLAHVAKPALRIVNAQKLSSTEILFRCNQRVLVDRSGDVVGTDGIADNGGIWVQDGSATSLTITALENVDDESYTPAADGTTKTLKATLSAEPVGMALEWFYANTATGDKTGKDEGARGLLRRPEPWGYIGDGGTDDVTVPFQSRIAIGERRTFSWCVVDDGLIH
ncbi:MAG: hypothetical protein JXR00_19430 [Sulfitobacter geojensis]